MLQDEDIAARASPTGMGYRQPLCIEENGKAETEKETPVKLKSYCAMDLHYGHTVIEAQTARGTGCLQRDVDTEAWRLTDAVKAVPEPKGIVIVEEDDVG